MKHSFGWAKITANSVRVQQMIADEKKKLGNIIRIYIFKGRFQASSGGPYLLKFMQFSSILCLGWEAFISRQVTEREHLGGDAKKNQGPRRSCCSASAVPVPAG